MLHYFKNKSRRRKILLITCSFPLFPLLAFQSFPIQFKKEMIAAESENDGQKELLPVKGIVHTIVRMVAQMIIPGFIISNGTAITKMVISHGPPGEDKGVGIYYSIEDVRNSGWKKIIVAGKDGLFKFLIKEECYKIHY